MSVLRAARTLGQQSGWSLSKMSMHKVLFVAHVIHFGRFRRPLFAEPVQAWRLGPVIPALHAATKSLGAEAVPDIFVEPSFAEESSEAQAIREAHRLTCHMYPSQLVDFTHRSGGAWATYHYENGAPRTIPDSAIMREWEEVFAPTDDAIEWASQVADDLETGAIEHLGYTDERSFRARLRPSYCH